MTFTFISLRNHLRSQNRKSSSGLAPLRGSRRRASRLKDQTPSSRRDRHQHLRPRLRSEFFAFPQSLRSHLTDNHRGLGAKIDPEQTIMTCSDRHHRSRTVERGLIRACGRLWLKHRSRNMPAVRGGNRSPHRPLWPNRLWARVRRDPRIWRSEVRRRSPHSQNLQSECSSCNFLHTRC